MSADGHDVPWGTGKAEFEELIRELHRLNIKPTMFDLEYSYDFEDNMAGDGRVREVLRPGYGRVTAWKTDQDRKAQRMNMSQIAIRRITEEKAAKTKLTGAGCNGMPLTCQVRQLSDDELASRLHALGIDIDRAARRSITWVPGGLPTGQRAARPKRLRRSRPGPGLGVVCDRDAVAAMVPQRPNLKMVDDRMQAGYAAAERHDPAEACRQWRQAWLAIIDLMQRFRIETIADFDEQSDATQCVFNWVQDYELELYNAGLGDVQFFHDRIALCQAVVERFGQEDLPTENFRSALAQSYFELGQCEIGDRLFGQWLDEDPQWGWGWIAWSDCHFHCARETKDAERALQILRQGLAVAGVQNRNEILLRLESVLTDAGREEEAADVRRQLERAEAGATDDRGIPQGTHRQPDGSSSRPMKVPVDDRNGVPPPGQVGASGTFLVGEGLPLPDDGHGSSSAIRRWRAGQDIIGRRQHVGRNDLCPCGSGRKFKKCCGRRR